MLEGHAQNFYRWWNDIIWTLQSKEPGQEAMPQCKWQMSDDPIDRSDPSDKHVYGRAKILPMVKWRHLNARVARKEPGQEAMTQCKWQMSDGPIDRIQRTSCLRSDKYFTDGEMTLFSKLGLPKVKSLGRRLCHNVSGKCQIVRSMYLKMLNIVSWIH